MRKMYLTDEIMARLEEFEQALKWAANSNFVGLKTSEFQRVMVIYKEIFGEELSSRQMACNTCRLNALKKIAAPYFETKAYNESKDKDEQKPEAKPEKKKPGRPKKIDI